MIDLTAGPHVRTRATGPAPEISLSTELPKLADIPGYEQLQAAEANPSLEEKDDKQAPAKGTDALSPPGDVAWNAASCL